MAVTIASEIQIGHSANTQRSTIEFFWTQPARLYHTIPCSSMISRRRILDDSDSSSQHSSDACDLVDTSSDENNDDNNTTPLPNRRRLQKFRDGVEELSTGMKRVNLGDRTNQKATPSRKMGITIWDSSSDSDSDDEILKTYQPKFTRISQPPEPENTSFLDETSEDGISSDDSETSESERGTWKLDANRKEYSLAVSEGKRKLDFRIPQSLYDTLYDHQKDGVAWMVGLHTQGIGGLLGDDMGMGKTYQTLTLIGGLMRTRTIKNALVVVPLTLMRSWEKEAQTVVKMCEPHVHIQIVSSSSSRNVRARLLQEALDCSPGRPHLIISTYGLVRSSHMDFVLDDRGFDYVILDEAQNIKNSNSQVAKNVRRISRNEDTRRLILTGTPIMNNLRELWALFDFVTAGKLLGPVQRFNNKFQRPIEDARSKDATGRQIEIGDTANSELQQVLKPFLLQRLKADYLADQLPTKRDMVIWTHLSEEQRQIYSEYVASKESAVADVLAGVISSPLEAVTWLKKLCGHPILIESENLEVISSMEPRELRDRSAKLRVLDTLVENLRKKGHRILIFSQSTKMLDIIERVLRRVRGMRRIDGSTKERHRQLFVDEFNDHNGSIEIMLLSTKAAGVGLTLTGADRAIIYDPSWNPAEDMQAVDRCYRIGQKREVSVYRLITAGTVEEKMYEKQIHKDGIRRAVVTSAGTSTTRYFDKHDLSKLFKLNPPGQCDFLERLREKNLASAGQGAKHEGIVGISSHDRVYATKEDDLELDSTTTDNPSSSQENPFSQLTAMTNALSLHTTVATAVPRREVQGRSQRVINRPSGTNGANSINLVEDEMVQKNPGQNAMKTFAKVDGFLAMRQYERAMELMMDLMEDPAGELSKEHKLQLHSRMSSTAYKLRWL